MQASFARLQSGSWGVRTRGATPRIGAVLSVQRRDGRTTSVTIARVLSSNADGALCAIESDRPARAGSSRWQGKRSNARRTAGVTFAVAPDAVPLEIDWDAEADAEERAAITRENGGRPVNRMAPEPTTAPLHPFGPNPFGDEPAEGDARRCARHGYAVSSADGLHDSPCPACEAEHDRAERDSDPAPFLWAAFDDHADDWSR